MKIIDLDQGSDAWLEWRKSGVSASEAAAAIGRDPHTTPWHLWAEKLGRIPRENLDNNPLVRRGKSKEDLARQRFEADHPGEILLPVCAESETDPRIRASLDGLMADNTPVELKCPHPTTMQAVLREGSKAEAWRRYWVQVQQQMFVAGTGQAYLCFYCDELADVDPALITEGEHCVYREFPVARDDDFIDNVLVPGIRSFLVMLDRRQEPKKDPERDIFVPDAKQYTAWQNAAEGWLRLDESISETKKVLASLEKTQATYTEAMVDAMGEFVRASACGVSLSRFTPSGPVNYKAIVEEKLGLTDSELDGYRRASKPQVRVMRVKQAESRRESKSRVQAPVAFAETLPAQAGEGAHAW